MKKLGAVDILVLILVILGGLNWGLVGIADFDLVAEIFGIGSIASRVVYVLVGLAAIYLLLGSAKLAKK